MIHAFDSHNAVFCGSAHGLMTVYLENCDCPDCWSAALYKYRLLTPIRHGSPFRRPFLSGPITGIPGAADVFHEAARDIESRVSEFAPPADCFVLNPIFIPELIGEGREHEDYMAISIPMLDTATLIFMLPGWRKSRGARMELVHAMQRKIPVLEWIPKAAEGLEEVK